jgi:PST family polysaccharide transporter
MSARQDTVSLSDRTSRAAVWVSAETVFTKIASLLSQYLLGWFLLREDFGIYALAMTVYTFAAVMHQAGIQEILIKRQRAFRVWANAAFWLSMCTGILAWALTSALAPLVVSFYSNVERPDDLVRLIRVMAYVFPLGAAGAVCRARLQIDMRFRDLALMGAVNTLLDVSLKVTLAWLGYGAFSFGYASVVGAAVFLAISWYMAPVPVKLTWQFRRWRYLLGDGVMLIGAAFSYWLIEEGDYIVLGRFASESVVGLYFFSYKIARHSMALLTFQFSRVLFPVLSRLPPESGQQTRAFVRASRMLLVFAIPSCLLMAAIAQPLVHLLFAERWYPAIPLIQVMCLGMSLRTISRPAQSLLQAQGRFRTRMQLALASVAVFFPVTICGTWLGSAWGLAIAVALYYSAMALVDLATALWPSGDVLRSMLRIFVPPLTANALALMPGLALGYGLVPRWELPGHVAAMVQIAAILSVTTIVYLVLIRAIAPDIWQDARERLVRMLPLGLRQRAGSGMKSASEAHRPFGQ